MGKSKLLLITFLCLCFQAYSQSTFFTKNTTIQTSINNDERIDPPSKEFFINLNIAGLEDYLENVGNRENKGNTIFTIPTETGLLKEYKIFEASVLEEEFQANYPNIRSFAGQGITNPEETIRFTMTSLGFQAIILGTPNGTQHIKPFDNSRNIYSSHFQKDVFFEDNSFECELIETPSFTNNNLPPQTSLFNANDGTVRDYRFAVSATSEYSAFYNNNLTDVISAMAISTSNANAVLERDLSITLTMIDNTSLIFFDANTDPFDNFDNIALLDQNQILIDNTIGDANYDIGHVFNTAGGGVAGLQTSCFPAFKAWGVTGATSATDGRFLFVLLHELGHQFGSPHTFNGSIGPCGTNISTNTALEPGSGSTIMGYPGLCGDQNVINSSAGDLYYHQISLATIWGHITNSGSCPGNQIITGNTAPVADAGADYLIPQGTPYKLVGSSTDIDGTSTHTYTWEQYDFGPQGAPTESTVFGPIVRSIEGTTNPTRYIPNLNDLLDFQGSSQWEILSAIDRDLNFRLTVRDNDSSGGQTAVDGMQATVTATAGPFLVTSQNVPNQIVWTPGTTETITWDVAGTDTNNINEANVNILLSTDEGLTYDTILVSNTPNDGTEDIIVPNLDATKCRIMIEAVNNIFFNINSAFFAIGDYTYDEVCEDYVINFNSSIPENSSSYNPFFFQITDDLEIIDLNFNVTLSGSEDNSSITYGYSPPFGDFSVLGVYPCPGTIGLNLTFDDEGSAIDCSNLNSGDNVLPIDPLSVADGENAQGNWTFWITDVNVDGVLSNIDSITLNICSVGLVPNLSIEDNSFEAFNIYPNPNQGSFNIELSSTYSDETTIQVYDLLGKLVYEKEFLNNSSLLKSVDLSNPSSGVYIVKVNQGKSSISKKLIVK